MNCDLLKVKEERSQFNTWSVIQHFVFQQGRENIFSLESFSCYRSVKHRSVDNIGGIWKYIWNKVFCQFELHSNKEQF